MCVFSAEASTSVLSCDTDETIVHYNLGNAGKIPAPRVRFLECYEKRKGRIVESSAEIEVRFRGLNFLNYRCRPAQAFDTHSVHDGFGNDPCRCSLRILEEEEPPCRATEIEKGNVRERRKHFVPTSCHGLLVRCPLDSCFCEQSVCKLRPCRLPSTEVNKLAIHSQHIKRNHRV